MSRSLASVAALLAILIAGGCSQPAIDREIQTATISTFARLTCSATPAFDHSSDATAAELVRAQSAIAVTVLPDPPDDASADNLRLRMDRLVPGIRDSTFEVCKGLKWHIREMRCEAVLDAPVIMEARSRKVSSYVDEEDNIVVFGGLAKKLTDDELAAVLAHEYAHVAFGHVNKKIENSQLGSIIANMAISELADGQAGFGQRANARRVGENVGRLLYSPEMEIEADLLAVYILDNAGYHPAAMHDLIVRLAQDDGGAFGWHSGRSELLPTHPEYDRRLSHIARGIRAADARVSVLQFR